MDSPRFQPGSLRNNSALLKPSLLLGRVERLLVESLNGLVQLPPGAPYVRAPGLGRNAGPLGAIALAMTAQP